MAHLFSSSPALPFALVCIGLCQTAPATIVPPRVIPRPQIEDYGKGMIRVARNNARIGFASKGVRPVESRVLTAGVRLLSKRLDQLSSVKVATARELESAQIIIDKCANQEMTDALRQRGAKCDVSGKRLMQAYVLECIATDDGMARIVFRSCSDQGFYYAIVSLCQLLDGDANDGVVVPFVTIADWPEIGMRLAKTSASLNPLPALNSVVEWMPLYKINAVGLQFHGNDSRNPTVFIENVKVICSSARAGGILETIVYFCPFRGKGYDFSVRDDRRKYAEFLRWILAQGAAGVEVDYNDWPGKGTRIEDVINLACKAVTETSPQAYVLYCPPNSGASQYRGPASVEMRRVLSKVPANVWPLWTGMATLIEKPLTVEQVEQWTRAAGRRPFLWVNRVSPRVKHAFARTVDGVPGAMVFRGDLLPKDFDRLFEGVHFNAVFSPVPHNELPEAFNAEALAYMATAADYVWNPQSWEAAESARRAQRFAKIMQALVGE